MYLGQTSARWSRRDSLRRTITKAIIESGNTHSILTAYGSALSPIPHRTRYAIGFEGDPVGSGARPPPHRNCRNPHNWAIAGGDFSRANLASCTRQHSVIRQLTLHPLERAHSDKIRLKLPNRKLINELAAHYRQCSRMDCGPEELLRELKASTVPGSALRGGRWN